MLKRWRLLRVEIVLVVILVVGAVVSFSLTPVNAGISRDKAALEARIRAANLSLSELEQSSAGSAGKILRGEADARAVTAQILQYAEKNNIAIVGWEFSYDTVSVKTRKYSAIKHSISAKGTIDALIGFVKALTQASVAPVVQGINMTGATEEANVWQAKLELRVYYD